ncbi:hypothetical protein BJ138DRAFT_1161728 [Hygrophoropsis aurantiaca]|uniref:Uncharacterized protein n=1 Tax=Hygrophoropsis aurantiaca TaxID=72124 RepID=A0ACB8A2F5_9AGAM|nr:hypothetical protein BJ138DRAFT_1161728 [Hygrophoropsis aurantiaca]
MIFQIICLRLVLILLSLFANCMMLWFLVLNFFREKHLPNGKGMLQNLTLLILSFGYCSTIQSERLRSSYQAATSLSNACA